VIAGAKRDSDPCATSYTLPLAAAVKPLFSGFKIHGNFTTLDLIAASTNALNGALLARRPDHYRNWTIVGVLLMALLMGLGGGITRDVLINKVPGALTNPACIIFALGFGTLGYLLAYGQGQLLREGLFQFMTSFSLPFYAIIGAQAGVTAGLPIAGLLFLAVVGPTAGRWYVDVSSRSIRSSRLGTVRHRRLRYPTARRSASPARA
jgi:uncharacterized membrane protein YeiH